MERLTIRKCSDFAIPRRGTDAVSIFQTVDRLADIEDILGDEYDLDELREMVQAKREGRVVVLDDITVSDLQQMLTVLDSTVYGDGVETYTTGYRNGNKNGRIEILRHILGIPDGTSEAAEEALKAREQK